MLLLTAQLEEAVAAMWRLPWKARRTNRSWGGGEMQIALNCSCLLACSSQHHPAASQGSRRPGVALLSPTSPAAKERQSLKPSS